MRFSTVCGLSALGLCLSAWLVPELSAFLLLGSGVAVCLAFLGLAAEDRI